MALVTDLSWYCVHSKRYKESWIARQLMESCHEVYLPLLRQRRRLRFKASYIYVNQRDLACDFQTKYPDFAFFGVTAFTAAIGSLLVTLTHKATSQILI